MEEITPSHQAYWKLAKALKSDGYLPTPALRKPDNTFAVDDREKAECLADSIEQQCSNNSIHGATHSHRIEEEVRTKISLEPQDDLAPVSEAVVIGLPKPGKPRDLPASYRPISLLSGLGKLFEKTIKTRLSEHLIGKGLIINEQFGFRPNHSCPQQVHRLVEHISEGFKKKRKTVAVFFDVAKAFDRVWHAGLIHKFYTLELPDRLVLIIHNYFNNRNFTFRHENTYSTKRTLKAGVPQGSTLSPLLYSAYVNDIPRPSNGVQLALFADDTALYLRGSNYRDTTPRLQRAIDELTRWLRLWRIKLNPEKSAAIRFNYSKHKKKFSVPYNTPTLHIDNASIPWQHNYKYLGVTLDKHLHFRDHVARVSKLTKFYQSRLYGMIGRKSKMSRRNKRTLYLMCIRPKIQNKFCRQATDAHWCVKNSVLHGDLELPTINKFMKDASKRFFDMAQNHPNPLIVSAATFDGPPPAHHFLRRPRNVLLDPPDALTSEVEKLAEAKSMQID
ncbi:Probable RNA-directed DNA polymerase from transposon BS [Eumeta japonica]|uniref:Probable RNA-directed DNA polymerase from transposon BS n=1 Tax=Eumeta variegata TaxID=151549 RepID=A0A4C1ZD83_EUMVA|nr:Probable RNA-directed DNA polymerase from transposon BS [Eumeta japonica]